MTMQGISNVLPKAAVREISSRQKRPWMVLHRMTE